MLSPLSIECELHQINIYNFVPSYSKVESFTCGHFISRNLRKTFLTKMGLGIILSNILAVSAIRQVKKMLCILAASITNDKNVTPGASTIKLMAVNDGFQVLG